MTYMYANSGVTSDGNMQPLPMPTADYVGLATAQVSPKAPAAALKFDQDKTQYYLLPLDLLDGTADVFSFGAKKYAADNFRKAGGLDPIRTLSSCMRHLAEIQRAIITNDHERMADPESGKAHIHHAICSLIMMVDGLRQRGWKV